MPLGAAKAALLGAAGSAGGGDDFVFIAKLVADGSAVTFDFTSIPQDYRDLQLVVSKGNSVTNTARMYIFVDIGSGFDTAMTKYSSGVIYSGGSASGTMQSLAYYGHSSWWAAADFPESGTNNNSATAMQITDYSNSATTTNMTGWYNPRVTTTANSFPSIGTIGYADVGAITGIRITRAYTTAGYEFASPTTFTLFGIGAS
jgi:hypothetical protein